MSVHGKYTPQLLEEYRDIMKAGFRGTIEEYIFYKNNYGRKQKKKQDQNEFNVLSDDDIPF